MRRDESPLGAGWTKSTQDSWPPWPVLCSEVSGETEQTSNHKVNAQGAAPQILWQPHQYLLHFEETKKWEWLPWAVMLSCLHRDLTTDRHRVGPCFASSLDHCRRKQ